MEPQDIVKKQEQKLWDDMRKNWDYIDKIYATQHEFERFKGVTLSEEEVKAPLEALFKPEKRMFLEDIAFIIVDNDAPKRIIFLNYLRKDIATLTAFDRSGNLFGKLFVKVKGFDVEVSFDKKNPVGEKVFKREFNKYMSEVKGILPDDVPHHTKNIEQRAVSVAATEMKNIIDFILAAIRHVLQAEEIRTIKDRPKQDVQVEEKDSGADEAAEKREAAISHAPKKLRKIVYEREGKKRPRPGKRKKEYTKRVETWKVRGHWRVYSDGNRTWVKPHVKGRKSKKYRAKGTDYRL